MTTSTASRRRPASRERLVKELLHSHALFGDLAPHSPDTTTHQAIELRRSAIAEVLESEIAE